MCRCAELHQLQGVLYHQCRRFLPPEYARRMERAYLMTVLSYRNRCAVLQAIDRAFAEVELPYLLFKGTEVAAPCP